ncbi:MAG: uroporphyrinogen-III synthase, partial [Synergistaceae bacterium]|nr:uroporphyrinogen-III synthase [Synergistaceae bacterium]
GGRVLMFRAQNGTPEIESVFRKYGTDTKQVCIYRIDYVKLLYVPNFTDIIIFTSSSTVRGFTMSVSGLRDALAVCIGKQTAEEAVNAGFSRVRIAGRADVESLAEACT